MPLYDYFCEHCGKTSEIHLSFQEKDAGVTPVCPKCGHNKMQQRLTAGMFIQTHGTGGRSTPTFGCSPGGAGGCCG